MSSDIVRNEPTAGSGNERSTLVSVIIPCYNQAHFLHEAIESVLAQSYSPFEIVVVDDGSTDYTAAVAEEYPSVQLIRQSNQGLSAARNTGLQHSTGGYLVFLDADDRLLSNALQAGVDALHANPECALVSGNHSLIAGDGTLLGEWQPPSRDEDPYCALLQRNYIAMHATVMYRRIVFEVIGNFNTSLRACEDYDLYLRIARRFPIATHSSMVAEYRRHGENMTHDSSLMLSSALAVLQSEWLHIRGNRLYEEAYRRGLRFWQSYYIGQLVKQLRAQLLARRWRKAAKGTYTLTRVAPRYVRGYLQESVQRFGRSASRSSPQKHVP